ncbi:heavy metal translocating P-type ATPase [Chromobacterium alticapitis]|uniref:P-type Zn(2+) transporter n=1 Tax=Chromobacterium alticapitis TaxID=2073169 RepID=A0A2S5DAN5_9NEIS|nr:cation-translocating P-type ATPase [Chromobacterium alticapitis]POZ60123.1 cadmium-translocating P-type ATPase [Chromobacterium alticapitis]
MSGCAHHAAPLLDADEQRRAGRRLLLTMLAGGLLLLAACWHLFVANGDALALLLAGAASLLLAAPTLRAAWHSLSQPDLHGLADLLVALAIVGAWAAGDLASAALLPILMELGHVLEERSLLGSREAIRALAELGRGSCRRLLPKGGVEEVDNDHLAPGDRLEIHPGDRIPADGIVLDGHASLDASPVTGEAQPQDVAPGSPVYAGALSLDGALRIEVSRVGAQSALGRVIELMQAAESSKPAITRFIERHASAYLTVALAVAAIAWFTGGGSQAALAVLVAACPCALVIAAPSTAVAGVAAAARHGILIRGPAFLEELADVDTLVIDKTGTLTDGRLAVQQIDIAAAAEAGAPAPERLAASLAAASSHPVSRALAALGGDAPPLPLSGVRETPGMGLQADSDWGRLTLGRPEWLSRCGCQTPAPQVAGSLAGLALDGRLLAWFHLADSPRPEAAEALRQLRELGLARQLLLSGDRADTARALAEKLGLEAEAQALPEDKLAHVRAEIAAGRSPLVVGDGINDTLALKAGAVGVALGARGADVAVAAADVVLTGNNLLRLATAIRLSRRCRAILGANVLIGLGWSAGLTALAAAGWLGPAGVLSAALLHNVGTLLVMGNSGRILRYRED